ncbi:diguanylate cyclase domain-containing protein [Marinisporobacter balticus]|uniref:Diguanylate cyclase (GGDEF)-like protein n=1 Tax=Marinisporobacter balticus TaxID=2018667 RepID=A0A4R2KSX4_9FIRM|nr:GGDEF domain-containing protein [Marinisporobacter balticus]TCO76884.1 diguanylate cyclase (GGDEF)-like protein [Marinisporobacter balticus]
MIRKVLNIMNQDFMIVNAIDGIRNIKNSALEKGISHFFVMEHREILGVITTKELIEAHPNRIAADAMIQNFTKINVDTPIWKAKELLEKNMEILLVEENKKVVGFITTSLLDIELGKHIDLLTGLYKSDYVYYHAAKFIKNRSEIAIIFMDVDNFGHVDKAYGHICGDNILKDIGMLLNMYKHTDTYLCRFGGDEFMIVTPYTIEQAKAMVKEIMNAVAIHKFQDEIDITISAGIVKGRKYDNRITNPYAAVSQLINIASLASTKAKKSKCKLSIVHETEIDESA